MKSVIMDCLPLAEKLPGSREKHLGRLCHTAENGYLLCLIDGGKVTGYAELYQLKDVPKHPVLPLPTTEENGKVLYVYALAVEANQPKAIAKMKRIGKRIFKKCDSLSFHARKKNNRLYRERWESNEKN